MGHTSVPEQAPPPDATAPSAVTAAGSPGAIAALFRDHHAELVRLALLMVGDLPTAEDVVQDVYASLHRMSRNTNHPESPLPYVRAAVLNGCRSVQRRRVLARRVGLAVTLASQAHPGNKGQASIAQLQPGNGPPKYYAEVEGKMYRWHGTDSVEVVVRATTTGAVVARVRNPVIAGLPKVMPFSVAAAPGDRTFYALYRNYGGGSQLWIYRFSILPSGHASALSRINGGPITGQDYLGNVGGFTVSPDGTRLALAVASDHDPNSATSAVAGQIVVINLRTGARAVWRGGLNRPGQVFGIQTLSWTGDGRSLAFQAQWCPPLDISYGAYGGFACSTLGSDPQDPHAEGVAELREIHVTGHSGGGSLSEAQAFMKASEHLQPGMPAIVDPGGKELITMVAVDTYTFEVVKTSIATGATTSDLGQVPGGWQDEFHLAADRSGRHVLVWMSGNDTNPLHGWVDGGYHQLAPTFPQDYPGNWIQLTW